MTENPTVQTMCETPVMRHRIALTSILIGTLAISGCAASPREQEPLGEQVFPAGQTLPSDLFAAARQSQYAPDAFSDTRPRKSCGDVTLKQGEEIPAAAVDCIDAAIGNLEAELVVVSLTTEGDPVVAFYRTAAATLGVEIFTDGEFDRFGPKTWTHQTCPQTTTVTSLQGCSEM